MKAIYYNFFMIFISYTQMMDQIKINTDYFIFFILYYMNLLIAY